MENARYCHHCGKKLDDFVTVCPICGADLDEKENVLKYYLVKNTKDKLRGKIEDSIFNAIKNWLLSHLYGVLVTITVIASIAIASADRTPSYIEHTDRTAIAGVSAEMSSDEGGEGTEAGEASGLGSDEMIDEATYLVERYQFSVFYRDSIARGGFVEDDGEETPEDPASFYLPASVGIQGAHDFWISNDYSSARSYFYDDSYTYDAPETEIGKQLKDMGYTVVEFRGYNGYSDEDTEMPADYIEEFQFVVVNIDGTWYLAEDRML